MGHGMGHGAIAPGDTSGRLKIADTVSDLQGSAEPDTA